MLTTQDRWIWPFELTEKIGEGGMGHVYKARYVVNDRIVAVKLVPSDVTDETILARFEREVEILKTLRHPNIVLCFGGACEDKRRFYAMEYVDGGTLHDLLRKRGRLPWELVVEYARQICSALAYAHDRGIIHRDLKPANFLISGDGRLKLSDFGLATLIAGRKITAAGRTAGTYEYMSPEQITGKEMTPRADLYSLGCVLYELLTGKPPFDGANSAEILHQHLKKPPPRVAAEVPDCPAALDRLLLDLLEKNPENRPAGALEVLETLREITPSIRIAGAAPTVGVSNRPTVSPPRGRPTVDAAETSATAGARQPQAAWLPLAFMAVVGVLLAALASRWQTSAWLSNAESEWITAFQQGEMPVRLRAAEALGKFGSHSAGARDALRSGLDDADPKVRAASVEAMGRCGRAAREFAPTLQKLQREDDSAEVRQRVPAALAALRESAAPTSAASWILVLTLVCVAGTAVWMWKSTPAANLPKT